MSDAVTGTGPHQGQARSAQQVVEELTAARRGQLLRSYARRPRILLWKGLRLNGQMSTWPLILRCRLVGIGSLGLDGSAAPIGMSTSPSRSR